MGGCFFMVSPSHQVTSYRTTALTCDPRSCVFPMLSAPDIVHTVVGSLVGVRFFTIFPVKSSDRSPVEQWP